MILDQKIDSCKDSDERPNESAEKENIGQNKKSTRDKLKLRDNDYFSQEDKHVLHLKNNTQRPSQNRTALPLV